MICLNFSSQKHLIKIIKKDRKVSFANNKQKYHTVSRKEIHKGICFFVCVYYQKLHWIKSKTLLKKNHTSTWTN
jgi:hypothetical protein